MAVPPGIESAAAHEAGHAVVASHHGIPVEEVRIQQSAVDTQSYCKLDLPDPITKDEHRDLIDNLGDTYAAGAIAERLLTAREPQPASTAEDNDQLNMLADELELTGADRDAWKDQRRANARDVIDRQRGAVDAVRDELVGKRRLDGDELDDVITSSSA